MLQRGDILAIFLLAAFLLAAALSLGFRNNFGLGCGWDCSHLPETVPVCVTKSPPVGRLCKMGWP
jgi:hypothetical protein